MRIVVNDIAANSGGAMTVLRDFYSYVCKNDHENEWLFLLNNDYFDETENVKIITLPQIKKSRIKKLLFDFVTGRMYIERLKPDVVFSLQNIITFGISSPQLVYIHQSIPFQKIKRFSFFKKEERKLAAVQYLIGIIIKLSARMSDSVIVQTMWIKDAVCRQCKLPGSKVVVNMPEIVWKQPLCPKEEFDKTQFFYPTAGNVYKNNECVRKASRILESRRIIHSVTMTLPEEGSARSVCCVGKLPHESVMAYYQRATLVFPSYIETVGYPLIEARAVGGLILASDTPFSQEVLTGYENAYFFDPFSPNALAELMGKVVQGEIVRKETQSKTEGNGSPWGAVVEHIISFGNK